MFASSSSWAQTAPTQISFFYSPLSTAHQPIINAINSATQSVKMVMFHLSDPAIENALIAAAKRKGVTVQVIFDKIEYTSPAGQSIANNLKAAGVQVVQATSGFRITHEKAMVIDDKLAMISTMNEVASYMNMFDVGLFTTDAGVIAEWDQVFQADLLNAANGGNVTPALNNPNLVWSPINSTARLTALIRSATTSIDLTVENLDDPDMQAALTEMAAKKIAVRIIVPQCDVGASYNFNYDAVTALRKVGIDARMMPAPASVDTPYVHAKTIVVDGQSTFIGSENFSTASLTDAREVGLISDNMAVAAQMDSLFGNLWQKAVLPPATKTYTCVEFSASVISF